MANARTFTGSAEINAMVARVAPAVLALLADGTPRSKAAIVEALAGRLRATHHATTRLGQPSFPPLSPCLTRSKAARSAGEADIREILPGVFVLPAVDREK